MRSVWAVKPLTNSLQLKGVRNFLTEKDRYATYKTLNKIRAAIASVSYCASEPGLSSNTRFLSQEPLYIQINVLKGGTEGFYFVTEKIFETIY